MKNKETILVKILLFFFILQRRKATDHTREFRRLNPYNPITYIFLSGLIAVSILLFGIVGVWESGVFKPFKWQ